MPIIHVKKGREDRVAFKDECIPCVKMSSRIKKNLLLVVPDTYRQNYHDGQHSGRICEMEESYIFIVNEFCKKQE